MKFPRTDSSCLTSHKHSHILPRTQSRKDTRRTDFDDLLVRSRVLRTGALSALSQPVLNELSREGDYVKLESRYSEK